MNRKTWTLLGLLSLLAILYVAFFTDWFAPAPIQISYQIRPTIQAPTFRRSTRTMAMKDGVLVKDIKDIKDKDKDKGPMMKMEAMPAPMADPAPGDAAYVTFSLDDFYPVDNIRVWELKPTNGEPRVIWSAKGKGGQPMNSLIYGRLPNGFNSLIAPDAEPLKPNAPYKLEIHAGRHRGEILFSTTATAPAEGS